MGVRQRDWAKRERLRMILALGSRCTDCHCTEQLEFDCIRPQGHAHHSREQSWRISFYRKQMRAGNLALRCKSCHAKKTSRDMGYEEQVQPPCLNTGSEEILNTLILDPVNKANNCAGPVLDGGTTRF